MDLSRKEIIHYCRFRSVLRFYPNSTNGHVKINHVGVTTIERPDQGHLYPLGEPRDTCHSRGANLRPPAPQASTLPKELSRQLIAGYSELLLGASGRPPQGSPSACVYMDSTGCRPNSLCKALGFIPFQGPRLHILQVRMFRITSGSPL